LPATVRVRHLIRSPITDAGIVGYARSSAWIRGSNASATDPFAGRSYRGAPSDRTAARTVFRETFTRADLSDLLRRIDAHGETQPHALAA
jgi:hypothetical protein